MTLQGRSGRTDAWQSELRTALKISTGRVDLLGVGNPIRRDDGVGLMIASELRRTLGATPAKGYRIHKTTPTPELLLSKLALKSGRIFIFDAVEASKKPGEIVCTTLSESKYGYFATHNIPLKLIPGLDSRSDDVYLVGVQPLALEIGEGLSDVVADSAARVVATVTSALEAGP